MAHFFEIVFLHHYMDITTVQAVQHSIEDYVIYRHYTIILFRKTLHMGYYFFRKQ